MTYWKKVSTQNTKKEKKNMASTLPRNEKLPIKRQCQDQDYMLWGLHLCHNTYQLFSLTTKSNSGKQGQSVLHDQSCVDSETCWRAQPSRLMAERRTWLWSGRSDTHRRTLASSEYESLVRADPVMCSCQHDKRQNRLWSKLIQKHSVRLEQRVGFQVEEGV